MQLEILEEINRIAKELSETYRTETEGYKENLTDTDNRIKFLQTINNNENIDSNTRFLAISLAVLEAVVKRDYISNLLTVNFLTQLTLAIKAMATTINGEFSQLNQSTSITSGKIVDKETIDKLKNELENLQKVTTEMQPYVDMLKIGIEKKNKWLADNR